MGRYPKLINVNILNLLIKRNNSFANNNKKQNKKNYKSINKNETLSLIFSAERIQAEQHLHVTRLQVLMLGIIFKLIYPMQLIFHFLFRFKSLQIFRERNYTHLSHNPQQSRAFVFRRLMAKWRSRVGNFGCL